MAALPRGECLSCDILTDDLLRYDGNSLHEEIKYARRLNRHLREDHGQDVEIPAWPGKESAA